MSIITDSPSPINGQAYVTYPGPRATPRAPTVELTGIVSDQLANSCWIYAFFTDGRFNWSVKCRAADLQSFAKFQAVAAEQRDIWIHHASQDELRAVRRKEEWAEAVRLAFAKGAGR